MYFKCQIWQTFAFSRLVRKVVFSRYCIDDSRKSESCFEHVTICLVKRKQKVAPYFGRENWTYLRSQILIYSEVG